VGFEEQKRQIDAKIAELRALLAAEAESAAKQPSPAPRKLSAEGRQRIIAATKRRWAVARKEGAARKRGTTETSGTGPRVGRESVE
jgi:hypothetical protein